VKKKAGELEDLINNSLIHESSRRVGKYE